MTAPFWSVIETIVLLNEARTLAYPEVTFFEPFALRTLTAPSSSFRRSSAVGCLATPCTISTGFCSAAGAAGAPGAAPSAGLAPLSPAALGALAFFSPAGAGAGAAAAGAPSAAGFAGFSFFGADFSSAMVIKVYASFAFVTPTVLRGPLRVRALVLVR